MDIYFALSVNIPHQAIHALCNLAQEDSARPALHAAGVLLLCSSPQMAAIAAADPDLSMIVGLLAHLLQEKTPGLCLLYFVYGDFLFWVSDGRVVSEEKLSRGSAQVLFSVLMH